MTVKAFIASDAVNLLLDSKWASGKSKADVLFTNRQSVVHYMDRLLLKGLFHRAIRMEKKKKGPPKLDEKEDTNGEEEKTSEKKLRKRGKKEKEPDPETKEVEK